MKITRRQLRKIIKETLLLEEPSDYYKDYKSGSISYAEYKQLVKDYENRSSGDRPAMPTSPSPKPANQNTDFMGREIKWAGTPKELEAKVHQYLIDIGFYEESHNGRVNPMSKPTGPDAHPLGGYTSSIPEVIKAGIANGEIDWANWHEIEPTYRKIDRSID